MAWQTGPGAPIVALDTVEGGRRSLAVHAGCALVDQDSGGQLRPVAGSGRFLLHCPAPEGQQLLDAHTGGQIQLATNDHWQTLGRDYAQGEADTHACRHSADEEAIAPCLALLDLDTQAVAFRAYWQVPDLDRAAAPPVCRRLRRKVLVARAGELTELWAYGEGRFAHRSGGHGLVRLERCEGRPRTLSGHGDARDFDIRGSLLTWDTGHDARFSIEGESGVAQGTLYSYNTQRHTRKSWRLPSVPPGPHERQLETGVFGYSTHTARTVFWIAAQSVGGQPLLEVEREAVYSAALR